MDLKDLDKEGLRILQTMDKDPETLDTYIKNHTREDLEDFIADILEYKANQDVESLTDEERRRLIDYGDHSLLHRDNPYEATRLFRTLDEFEKLRTVADWFPLNNEQSYDNIETLVALEDHEGIRDVLNRGNRHLLPAFSLLNDGLNRYQDEFLQENGTPVATGNRNDQDLVAIRNLAGEYDIAVPIARGGLKQGAIAHLWDMPTQIINVSAHNRKRVWSRWVNDVEPSDFDGKRVLLLDKDAVSGATIRTVLRRLTRYRIASIGVYFAHSVETDDYEGLTKTDGLPQEIRIHDKRNTSMANAGDAYIEAHERLGTMYGQRRLIKKLFMDEAEKYREKAPELSEALREYALEQSRSFDALNPNLPGVSEVRRQALNRMQQLYKTIEDVLGTFSSGEFGSFAHVADNIVNILRYSNPLHDDFAKTLVRARYKGKEVESAKERGVKNPHYPSEPLAAFSAALEAVKDEYDFALIVGPEGFSYEPYFKDLGIQTVAVDIPESREGVERIIEIFDELSVLRNKRVLVVEDDVRSGATLEKVLEHLEPHNPSHIGLYLGQPKNFQKLENVPEQFKNIYVAPSDSEGSETSDNFVNFLKARKRRIFKTDEVVG